MSDDTVRSTQRPEPDRVLVDMAEYALREQRFSNEALATARYCLMDSLGCALLALDFLACTKLLGPVVPGAVMQGGARVPGTAHELGTPLSTMAVVTRELENANHDNPELINDLEDQECHSAHRSEPDRVTNKPA